MCRPVLVIEQLNAMEESRGIVRKEGMIILLLIIVLVVALSITIYTMGRGTPDCARDVIPQSLFLAFIVLLSITLGGIITHALRSKERASVDYI